jgi:hypothetical protein
MEGQGGWFSWFMAGALVLYWGCRRRWQAKNGFLTLEIDAGRVYDHRVGNLVDVGLPFGSKTRLVLYHLDAEALRTRSPVIKLEESLTGFVRRTLGPDAHSGYIHPVRDQFTRLAASDFRIGRSDATQAQSTPRRASLASRQWIARFIPNPDGEDFKEISTSSLPRNPIVKNL